MRTTIGVSFLLLATFFLIAPRPIHNQEEGVTEEPPLEVVIQEQPNTQIHEKVRQYLESKNSPLAEDVEQLTSLTHWKLLIAISAIESQYCKRQLNHNCWGVTKIDGEYGSYDSFIESAIDADALITRWQERGRWLTIEDMNGHYVVPRNDNWVYVVNLVLSELNALTGTTTSTTAEDAEQLVTG